MQLNMQILDNRSALARRLNCCPSRDISILNHGGNRTFVAEFYGAGTMSDILAKSPDFSRSDLFFDCYALLPKY